MAKNSGGKLAQTIKNYQSEDDIAEALTPSQAKGALMRGSGSMVREGRKPKPESSEEKAPSKLKLGLGGLGASAAAQGINEGWSWLMRAVGNSDPTGWWARNNDYLQASAPTVVGFVWYVIELFKLGNKPPSVFKMSRMEAANLAMNLGLSKFWQALRSRSRETKDALSKAQTEAQKLNAENVTLSRNLEKLQQRLAEIEKESKGASK